MPDDLKFSADHLWIRLAEEGSYTAGITDHAQRLLGDIVFVDAPAVGSRLQQNEPCGLVESVKTASDLHAPLSGKVLEVNQDLQTNPERINDQPYQAWIFRFLPDTASDADALMNAAAYQSYLNEA
jgi:glycine cleavage system H protein